MQGTYKLEVWGAQGGVYSTIGIGGKGGVCKGDFKLQEVSQKFLYLCVGGAGEWNKISAFNNGELSDSKFIVGGSGGGCTSVCSSNYGILTNYTSHKDDVLLVAGGGGSCEWVGQGGDGGYPNGEDGTPMIDQGLGIGNKGSGGNQSAGGITDIVQNKAYSFHTNGTFGMGGYGYLDNTTHDYGAQGGGGWYGGGGASYAGAAGGGSSYYKQDTITNFTYKNGVREGNGFAIITWVR